VELPLPAKKALEEVARKGPEFLIDLIADAASSRLGLALAFADTAEEETRRWRRYNDSKEKTGGLGNWI
jgi:hypothetical protein